MCKPISLEENEKIEKNIQGYINKKIEKNESFLFLAGAGSGKTYALTQSIKKILKQNTIPVNSGKKILCITYTNVAKNKMKRDIGESTILEVSTIHEKLWELIKKFQEDLISLNEIKIKEIIKEKEQELEKIDSAKVVEDITQLDELINSNCKSFKKEYYNSRNLGANDLKENLKSFVKVKTVTNFKNYVDTKFKLNKLKNRDKISEIKYSNEKFDSLQKGKISHDTLLEYGSDLFKFNKLLKKAVIDKYPYIFVDECQDTDLKVIELLSFLDEYSKNLNKNFVVGYYGDLAQNIYDGVGKELKAIHKGLEKVEKPFNRRSAKKIIEVGNSIREDGLEQRELNPSISEGIVEVSIVDELEDEGLKKVISDYQKELKEPLDCFLLTNKKVAEGNGFSEIFDLLSTAPRFDKGDKLQEEFLKSKAELKPYFKVFFKIINKVEDLLKTEISSSKIYELIPINLNIKIHNELRKKLREKLLGYQTLPLEDLFVMIEGFKDNDIIKNYIFKSYFEEFEGDKLEQFKKKFASYLENREGKEGLKENELGKSLEVVTELFKIKCEQYKYWVEELNSREEESLVKKNIRYHTYHGTKGEEYDNVLIILDKTFGGYRIQFDKYFDDIAGGEQYKNKEKASNLLYVACTRARKTLKVVCTEKFNEQGLEKIFGTIEPTKEPITDGAGS